jgi:TRAP-type C4-dicarboxylate transport system permease large subunit
MDAHKLHPMADAAALEVAKVLPPAIPVVIYGLTLEKWLLVLPALYYFALLVDLVARRWVVPLWRIWLERRKEKRSHDAG